MRKKKPSEEPQFDDSWLLPYADMLTLLLALFIILFAMSELDAQKYKQLTNIFKSEFFSNKGALESEVDPVMLPEVTDTEVVEKDDDYEEEAADGLDDNERDKVSGLIQLQSIQEEIEAYIEKNNMADMLGTKLSDEGLLITILTDISFDSGSAHVNGEGVKIAKEVASFLHTDPPHEIVISGHADDRPMYNKEFKSNWELSVMRAVNFMSLLLDNKHLDPEKFSAKGYGEYKPIVPNTNEENRAKNRRVEVLILPNFNSNLE